MVTIATINRASKFEMRRVQPDCAIIKEMATNYTKRDERQAEAAARR
jgi:hypothetical protein